MCLIYFPNPAILIWKRIFCVQKLLLLLPLQRAAPTTVAMYATTIISIDYYTTTAAENDTATTTTSDNDTTATITSTSTRLYYV